MRNAATVLCVVLFASASNVFNGAQADDQTATGGFIAKMEESFVDAQLSIVSASTELGERTLKYTEGILKEIPKVVDNIKSMLEDAVSTGDVTVAEVQECAPPSEADKLGELAKRLTTTLHKCADDKVAAGLGHLEGLQKVYDDVLRQLEGVKEEASHCGEKSPFYGALCTKTAEAKATWISVSASPQLASGWAKFKLLSATLNMSLDICIRDDRFAYNSEASFISAKIEKCIKQKIADASAEPMIDLPGSVQ